MNKLVIVGNGFDLAHGLKTGYQAFIIDFIKCGLKECYDGKDFNHPLLSLSVSYTHLLLKYFL